MDSLLCVKSMDGNIEIHDEKYVATLLEGPSSEEMTEKMKYMPRASAKRSSRRSAPRPKSTSYAGNNGQSPDMDAGCLINNTMKMQDWLSKKQVTDMQENNNKQEWLKERKSLLRICMEKSQVETKGVRQMYSPLLETEQTFVKDVGQYLDHVNLLELRKKELLHKNWNEKVYEPIRRKILSAMNGQDLSEKDRRRRELHRQYLEYVNRKGHVFLDTMDKGEYYAQALYGHRPAPITVSNSCFYHSGPYDYDPGFSFLYPDEYWLPMRRERIEYPLQSPSFSMLIPKRSTVFTAKKSSTVFKPLYLRYMEESLSPDISSQDQVNYDEWEDTGSDLDFFEKLRKRKTRAGSCFVSAEEIRRRKPTRICVGMDEDFSDRRRRKTTTAGPFVPDGDFTDRRRRKTTKAVLPPIEEDSMERRRGRNARSGSVFAVPNDNGLSALIKNAPWAQSDDSDSTYRRKRKNTRFTPQAHPGDDFSERRKRKTTKVSPHGVGSDEESNLRRRYDSKGDIFEPFRESSDKDLTLEDSSSKILSDARSTKGNGYKTVQFAD